MKNLRKAAAAYRAAQTAQHRRETGAVIIHQGAAVGWHRAPLETPNHWEPGVYAVFTDGRAYVTAGGNCRNGADRWEEVTAGGAK